MIWYMTMAGSTSQMVSLSMFTFLLIGRPDYEFEEQVEKDGFQFVENK